MTSPIRAGDSIVDIQDLTRSFRGNVALHRVSLRIERGSVLGLVGINGAGKTTLLRHVLGLLAPQSGRVRVFGLDPVADPVAVLSRIGHLSEGADVPGWMRLGEYLRYTGAFYARWDADLAAQLCTRFGLSVSQKLNTLSRGMRVRAGLVAALAHRPELLVLDEPSAGLDPLARRDILQAVIRTAGDAGTTVLFSSHLLDEVERIADSVALLDGGRLVFSGAIDAIRDRHRRLTLRFAEPRLTPPALAGVLRWEGEGREWSAVCEGEFDRFQRDATDAGAEVIDESVPQLLELLAAHSGSHPSFVEGKA